MNNSTNTPSEQSYVGRGSIANPTDLSVLPIRWTASEAIRPALLPDQRQSDHLPPDYLIGDPVDPNEIWRPFPGYVRRYEISNMGRVCTAGGLIMYPSRHPDGYECVWLPKPHSQNVRACSIHWAVAMAFLPNPLGYPFVKHIDGNPFNNKVFNLEWCGLPTTDSPSLTSSTLPSHE